MNNHLKTIWYLIFILVDLSYHNKYNNELFEYIKSIIIYKEN